MYKWDLWKTPRNIKITQTYVVIFNSVDCWITTKSQLWDVYSIRVMKDNFIHTCSFIVTIFLRHIYVLSRLNITNVLSQWWNLMKTRTLYMQLRGIIITEFIKQLKWSVGPLSKYNGFKQCYSETVLDLKKCLNCC